MTNPTPSQVAASKRALAEYFESVGRGLAEIGEPDAPDWLAKAAKIRTQLKPREVATS